MIYAKSKKELEEKGVIFTSTDEALKNHYEIFRKFFSKLVDSSNNKFSAMNLAF